MHAVQNEHFTKHFNNMPIHRHFKHHIHDAVSAVFQVAKYWPLWDLLHIALPPICLKIGVH